MIGGIMTNHIKDKIFKYLSGEITVNDIYDWAAGRKEYGAVLENLRERSEILFYLLNESGMNTRDYYPETQVIICEKYLLENVKRTLKGEIARSDLFNWADDVYSWELVEGFESEKAELVVKHISSDLNDIECLEDSDLESIIWHIGNTHDNELLKNKIELIFSLPHLRKALYSENGTKERLTEVSNLAPRFSDEKSFNELFAAIKILAPTAKDTGRIEDFFAEVSKAASPLGYISSE
jgi:hypothetical protein